MEGKKQTVFIVSIGIGYRETEIVFSDIQKATEFFTTLNAQILPSLSEVSKNGKKAYHITSKYEVKIETKEVVLYKDKKSAEFAVFGEESKSNEDNE